MTSKPPSSKFPLPGPFSDGELTALPSQGQPRWGESSSPIPYPPAWGNRTRLLLFLDDTSLNVIIVLWGCHPSSQGPPKSVGVIIAVAGQAAALRGFYTSISLSPPAP